jgi:hypothetical protein
VGVQRVAAGPQVLQVVLQVPVQVATDAPQPVLVFRQNRRARLVRA